MILVFCWLALAASVTSSLVPVEVRMNGMLLINQCPNKFLGGIFPDLDSETRYEGWEGSSQLRQICPILRYTCCSADQILSVAQPLKKLNRFLRFREENMIRLFTTIQKINLDRFKQFLSEFSEKDVKCYNQIQKSNLERKMEKFSKSKSILKNIKEEAKQVLFDKAVLARNFHNFLDASDHIQKELRAKIESRERYYSSFICTMCSPDFFKNMRFDGDWKLFYVKRDMCNYIIQHEIWKLNLQRHLYLVQKMVDLAFCARQNSKTQMNYSMTEYSDFNLVDFDFETIPDQIKRDKHCIEDPDPFETTNGRNEMDYCTDHCAKNMEIFTWRPRNIQSIMIAENELNHMFLQKLNSISPELRLKQMQREYLDKRKPFIENGQISLEEGGVEAFHMVQTNKGISINSIEWTLNVQLYIGADLSLTEMDKYYYEAVSVLSSFSLLSLIMLLK